MNSLLSGLFRNPIARAITILVAIYMISLSTWVMDRASLSLQFLTYAHSYGFFANALPAIFLFATLLVLSNRLVSSTAATLAIMAVLYAANSMKMHSMVRPIVFSDILFLREINTSVLRLLANYLRISWLLMTVFFIFAITVIMRYETVLFKTRSISRWFIALILISTIFIIIVKPSWARQVYATDKLRVVSWSPGETQLHCGLLGSIVYDAIESIDALRQPVNYKAIDRFLAIAPAPSAPWHKSRTGKPDIVVIQSESFFDPSTLKGIDNTGALLPNLHRAQALGYGGKMEAPTFGGGTLRTEFEVLTGVPMKAIPRVQFPYLQLHPKIMPSLVQAMHDNGYASYAVHPNDPTFWNRKEAFRAMGFDTFYSLGDFPANAAKDGWYLADSALTDKIESILDQTVKPTFIMAISIEGHGPYDEVPVANKKTRDRIEAPATWAPEAISEYRNYAYHIGNADHELGRLWDYLEERKKPYILVFYGDHLPGLLQVYKAAGGFDNNVPGDRQPVPWLLISNYEAEPQSRDIYAWMLGGTILCAAGITPPDYYALLNRAGTLLSNPKYTAHKDRVLSGVNSLAQLHLRKRALPGGSKDVAKQAKCFYPMQDSSR